MLLVLNQNICIFSHNLPFLEWEQANISSQPHCYIVHIVSESSNNYIHPKEWGELYNDVGVFTSFTSLPSFTTLREVGGWMGCEIYLGCNRAFCWEYGECMCLCTEGIHKQQCITFARQKLIKLAANWITAGV